MNGVLIKRGNLGAENKQKKCYVKIKAEIEVMLLQTKKMPKWPKKTTKI